MKLPNGLQLAIASTFAAAKTMSALTNADPGVATIEASHGVATSDIIEVSSGWGALDQRIVRAGTVATNDVPLEGIDTTSASRYPAGSGTGTVREITAWTALSNILSADLSGGDQQFYQYLFLDDPSFTQRQIPTFRNAMSLALRLDDDSTKPWYAAVLAASEARTNYALRITLTNGNLIYLNGVWSMNEMPTMTANEGMALDVSFSLAALPTRYAS